MPSDEQILVIPTAHFHKVGYFHGFRRDSGDFRKALLDPAVYQFRRRAEMETDPAFKQLIPYVLLKFGTDLFRYRRGASGNEKRLQALWSVGIGGHINQIDAEGNEDWYRTGMQRELNEEVDIACPWSERFLGFINDDQSLVGSVHLGVVHLLELQSPLVSSREEALAEAGFAPLTDLAKCREQFETWSRFVLEALASDF